MGADRRAAGSQLDAAVIHDVKNRLAILGDELAKLGSLELPPEARAHAAVASKQTRHITRKLVEYLTLRRAADPGGLRASASEELPVPLLEEILADARILAGKRLEIDMQIEPGTPPFWFFDRYLVLLALDSALYNALRFATHRVLLGARAAPEGLCLYVRDDGPGVQTAPDACSTGLGLRVCEAVAQAHRNKGRHGLSLLRNNPGGPGALFELILP